MMTVERVSNGWIVKDSYRTCVYTSISEVLHAVYQQVYPGWHVGDVVQIIRNREVIS